jgi:hypothetical protein
MTRADLLDGGESGGTKKLALGRDLQKEPARDEDLQTFGRSEKLGDLRSGVDDLLEVIEHEQHVLIGEMIFREDSKTGRPPASLTPNGCAMLAGTSSGSDTDESSIMNTPSGNSGSIVSATA